MPLDARQRKIVQQGKAACAQCGDHLADLRRRGYPDEGLEAKHEAMLKFFGAGDEIVSEFDADQQQGGKRVT